MLGYLKKMFSFSIWQARQYRPVFLFALFLIFYMGSGCNSASSKERYENLELGISLEKPTNWSVEFYERGGFIALEAEQGIWNKKSASIEINGYACNLTHSTLVNISKELLEADIKRIQALYELDSVVVLQGPIITENEEYIIGTTVIQIPAEALPEDSGRNQVGQGKDIFQTIDILGIKDKTKNAAAMVHVYKGLSEELNAEAQDIVDSIEFICSTPP